MRSFILVVAAIGGLSAVSLAANAAEGEKSAPVKGPPNANGSENSAPHSEKMKGSPNASGYDSSKTSGDSKAK